MPRHGLSEASPAEWAKAAEPPGRFFPDQGPSTFPAARFALSHVGDYRLAGGFWLRRNAVADQRPNRNESISPSTRPPRAAGLCQLQTFEPLNSRP
jgi:hypothetical protein